MKNYPESTTKIINYSRPLFALGLIAGSLLSIASPTLAETTPIKNQATATYEDPDEPANPNNPTDPKLINATSNIVEVTVQEVAGITIAQKGITDVGGATLLSIQGGDTVYFRFDVTNIGNDGTTIYIPNKAGITGAGVFQKVQYLNGTTWTDIPPTGLTSGNVVKNGFLSCRVVVKLNDGANGDIAVSLGKTTPPNSQNVEILTPNLTTLKTSDRVFTIDNLDTVADEITGAPINGTREAMDTQTVAIGKQPQAFATLKKTAGAYIAADNSITYALNLKVEDTVPTQAGNFSAADLVGTNIPGLGLGILAADAVPLGTQLSSLTAPTGWVPVYQYGTAIGASDRADTATWTKTKDEANSANLRRVGFFLADGRIAKSTAVTGFQFKVSVIAPLTTTTVYNIAQLFGNSPANPGDATDKTPNPNLPVVEESGDNNPNNFNNDGTPGPKDLQGKPVVTPGIVDATSQPTDARNPAIIKPDTNGNNTGEGENGEYVITPINAVVGVLNGPKDRPDAIGLLPNGLSSDNNHDFTNKSTPVAAGVQKGNKFDPSAIGFTNTVKNTANLIVDIQIIPTIKADEALPEGTKVTLKDALKPTTDPGVTFTVTGGKFVPDVAAKPTLILAQIAGNANASYTTIVDLPTGTDALKSYPVVLIAFVDRDNNKQLDTGESQNQTIDRIYTGFIDLLKQSRILDTNKQPLNEFSPATKLAKSGQYIEYQIKFKNISTVSPDGSGSKALTAQKFTITEDGNASPNNWAVLTEHDPGSATPTPVFSPAGDTKDVIKYVYTVPTLAPQAEGTFSFRRKVNQ